MIALRILSQLKYLAWFAALSAHTTLAQDAAEPPRATISGRIVLEDGALAKVEASLHSESFRNQDGNNSIYNSGQGRFRGEFSIKAPPGEIWLKCFVKGYAPVAVGPFTLAPGEKLDNTLIQLKRGREARLRIVSAADGKPVAGVSLQLWPHLGKSSNGEGTSIPVGDKGETVLKNLADATYSVRATAPGYEPLDVENQALSSDEVTELSMTRALPATGVVYSADGKPAKGAKIIKKLEGSKMGARSYYDGAMTTTDDAGRFTLDQLSSNLEYLFVVEGADHSRAVVRNLRPGVDGVEIRLPKDQNLRVKLTGDLKHLPAKNGKHNIIVSQTMELNPPELTHSSEINGVAKINPTDDGGVAEYKGLISGVVRVRVGDETVTANVVENGLTEVIIELRNHTAE